MNFPLVQRQQQRREDQGEERGEDRAARPLAQRAEALLHRPAGEQAQHDIEEQERRGDEVIITLWLAGPREA